jgi:peptidoglycan/xylan/chitin deacetylase (PgdA/CDA1 family)
MKRWADRWMARAAPLGWWGDRTAFTALAWHDVHDADAFERQIRWLRAETDLLDPAELVGILAGAPAPRRPTVITFDDGDRSVLDAGAPVLRAWGARAILFVIASLIGTDEPFWWAEVEAAVRAGARLPELGERSAADAVRWLKRVPDDRRRAVIAELRRQSPPFRQRQLAADDLAALVRSGVTIGNHTLTHPCLDRTEDAAAVSEIRDAHLALVGLGHRPRWFAWPNGNLDSRGPEALASLGYHGAFAFDHRRHPRGGDRWAISRVRVDTRNTPERFRAIVSGWHPRWSWMRGAARPSMT